MAKLWKILNTIPQRVYQVYQHEQYRKTQERDSNISIQHPLTNSWYCYRPRTNYQVIFGKFLWSWHCFVDPVYIELYFHNGILDAQQRKDPNNYFPIAEHLPSILWVYVCTFNIFSWIYCSSVNHLNLQTTILQNIIVIL